ncbi:MAG: hypothetical protein AAF629_37575 [Chloroflexota bacterium]
MISTLLNKMRQNGIYIVAIWSLILAVQNLITLAILSQSIRGFVPDSASFWIVLYQIVSVGFSLSFFMAAIGLWRHRHWGRNLFLITAVLFFLVSLIGIFTIQQEELAFRQKLIFAFRYVISSLLPLVYLNMDKVKARFQETQKGSTL